jgi:hypothetical protein
VDVAADVDLDVDVEMVAVDVSDTPSVVGVVASLLAGGTPS